MSDAFSSRRVCNCHNTSDARERRSRAYRADSAASFKLLEDSASHASPRGRVVLPTTRRPSSGANFPKPAQAAPEVYEARLDGKGELRRNVPGNFVLQFCLAYPLARGRPAVRARQHLVVLSCLSSASLPGARPSLAVLSCLPLARLDERNETRTVSRPRWHARQDKTTRHTSPMLKWNLTHIEVGISFLEAELDPY